MSRLLLIVKVSEASDELLLHWSNGQVQYLDNTFFNIVKIMWWSLTQRVITRFEFEDGTHFDTTGR